MNILTFYGTSEGQTRRICQFCADALIGAGHSVEVMQPGGDESDFDLARFDAAIGAGSVHMGAYQADLAHFAVTHADALNARPSLFLSVSLAIVGEDPTELADLDEIAARFIEDTGWTPGQVAQVAGAFRFTQYDFLKSWAMRWIASRKGQDIDPQADTEYTDWTALRGLVLDLAGRIGRGA